MTDIPPCPECRVGKCGNCDGGAWDLDGNVPAVCPCYADGHPKATP